MCVKCVKQCLHTAAFTATLQGWHFLYQEAGPREAWELVQAGTGLGRKRRQRCQHQPPCPLSLSLDQAVPCRCLKLLEQEGKRTPQALYSRSGAWAGGVGEGKGSIVRPPENLSVCYNSNLLMPQTTVNRPELLGRAGLASDVALGGHPENNSAPPESVESA